MSFVTTVKEVAAKEDELENGTRTITRARKRKQ